VTQMDCTDASFMKPAQSFSSLLKNSSNSSEKKKQIQFSY
jgi:hypothetical protein